MILAEGKSAQVVYWYSFVEFLADLCRCHYTAVARAEAQTGAAARSGSTAVNCRGPSSWSRLKRIVDVDGVKRWEASGVR